MGSGCIVSNNTGFSSSFKTIPDTSVKYTGPAIPELGICTGDYLDEVEAIILQNILLFAAGKGITLEYIDLTQCDCFVSKVGCCGKEVCQTLECVLQAYLDCMCDMYSDIQDIKVEITNIKNTISAMFDGPYDTKCLSGVTSASKLPAITQAMIDQICVNTSAISNITTNFSTNVRNEVLSMIQSCQVGAVIKAGTGASATVTFKGFVPIGGIMPMAPSGLANFDASGLGKSNTDACGWALCDGRNGTINMIGLVPVCTTDMTGGSPYLSGPTMPVGVPGGLYSVSLVTANIPTMPFSAGLSGASAALDYYQVSRKHAQTGDNTMGYMPDGVGTSTPPGSAPNGHISITFSGGSVSGTVGGGGSAHENRMPYMPLYYIQRIA